MKKLLVLISFSLLFASCKVEGQGIAGFQTYLDTHWKGATAYHSLTAPIEGAMLDSILYYIMHAPTLKSVSDAGDTATAPLIVGNGITRGILSAGGFTVSDSGTNRITLGMFFGGSALLSMKDNTSSNFWNFTPYRLTAARTNYPPDANGTLALTFDHAGLVRDSVTTSTGHTITIAGPSPFIILDGLSGANGTVTLPTALPGTPIKIWNINTSGTYHWSFAGGVTFDPTESAFTTLTNQTFYILYNTDGTNWLVVPQ